jgi:hypothetical protein
MKERILLAASAVALLLAATPVAHADPGYDMTVICRAKDQQGREFAITLIESYYGVSESTAVRVVSDC